MYSEVFSRKGEYSSLGISSVFICSSVSAQESFKQLSDVLSTGVSCVVKSDALGEVTIDCGKASGRHEGSGLRHIIADRFTDGKNIDEVAVIVYLVVEAVKHGVRAGKSHSSRIRLEKDGVAAIVCPERFGKDEKWLLTGFDISKKKLEATEAIRTVSAQYGQSPEFSDFRTQVGAVVSSASISHSFQKKSSLSKNINSGFMEDVMVSSSLVASDMKAKVMKWTAAKPENK